MNVFWIFLTILGLEFLARANAGSFTGLGSGTGPKNRRRNKTQKCGWFKFCHHLSTSRRGRCANWSLFHYITCISSQAPGYLPERRNEPFFYIFIFIFLPVHNVDNGSWGDDQCSNASTHPPSRAAAFCMLAGAAWLDLVSNFAHELLNTPKSRLSQRGSGTSHSFNTILVIGSTIESGPRP